MGDGDGLHGRTAGTCPAAGGHGTSVQLPVSAVRSLNPLLRFEEAESMAHEAVKIRLDLIPNEWGYFNGLSGNSADGSSSAAGDGKQP